MKISSSLENYLEIILELSSEHEIVRVTDIAKRLCVAKASVNRALGELKKVALLEQQRYGTIVLTFEGESYAREVHGKHHLFYDFLSEVLGVSALVAEKDACKLEHVVSQETIEKWVIFMEQRAQEKKIVCAMH